MDDRVAAAQVPAGLLLPLTALVNVVVGLHYLFADGGNPVRTRDNHLAGWVQLAAAVCVVAGLLAVFRAARTVRRVLLVGLLALAVGVGGVAAGHELVVKGESCACEGG